MPQAWAAARRCGLICPSRVGGVTMMRLGTPAMRAGMAPMRTDDTNGVWAALAAGDVDAGGTDRMEQLSQQHAFPGRIDP